MGVGGPRWCVVCVAAFLPIVPAAAEVQPGGAVPVDTMSAPSAAPPSVAAPNAPVPAPGATLEAPPPASARTRWTMPHDAARRYSPFVNGTLGGLWIGERFDSSASLGGELGAFFGRWRVSLRALFPFGVYQQTGVTLSNPDFQSIASTKPALIWGGTAGFALYTSQGFVASVGLNYMRSDVSEFGNMLGVSLPLEWVTVRGIRVGFEGGFLRAFGGEVLGECKSPHPFETNPPPRDCDRGEIRAFDREAANGGWLHFLVGIPFDQPEPVVAGSSE